MSKEETDKNIEYDKKNENVGNNKYEREKFNNNRIYNTSRIKKKEKKNSIIWWRRFKNAEIINLPRYNQLREVELSDGY